MKNLFILLLITLGLSCSNKDKSSNTETTKYSTEKALVSLDINRSTTKLELIKIKEDFRELNGLYLNIDSTIFDKEGKISKLNIRIKTKEGIEGILNTDVAPKAAGFSIEYGENKNGCLKTYVIP
jgi:hypothetical protein